MKEANVMANIMILNGAARKNGRTASLVKAFMDGAERAGNTVREFYLQDNRRRRVNDGRS